MRQAEVVLLRDGKELQLSVCLRGPKRLVPVHIDNRPPSYFIIAGLVFTPVTIPFLKSEYGKVRRCHAFVLNTEYSLYCEPALPLSFHTIEPFSL